MADRDATPTPDRLPASLVPGEPMQPSQYPIDDMVASEPLDIDGSGSESVVFQENVGAGEELGGGEFPDRDTPPAPPARGSTGWEPDRDGTVERGNGRDDRD